MNRRSFFRGLIGAAMLGVAAPLGQVCRPKLRGITWLDSGYVYAPNIPKLRATWTLERDPYGLPADACRKAFEQAMNEVYEYYRRGSFSLIFPVEVSSND